MPCACWSCINKTFSLLALPLLSRFYIHTYIDTHPHTYWLYIMQLRYQWSHQMFQKNRNPLPRQMNMVYLLDLCMVRCDVMWCDATYIYKVIVEIHMYWMNWTIEMYERYTMSSSSSIISSSSSSWKIDGATFHTQPFAYILLARNYTYIHTHIHKYTRNDNNTNERTM